MRLLAIKLLQVAFNTTPHGQGVLELTLQMAVQSQDNSDGIVVLVVVLAKLKLAGAGCSIGSCCPSCCDERQQKSCNDSASLALIPVELVMAGCRRGWPVVQPGSSHLL